MSAKWGYDWVRLYCHPSQEWLSLSYSARGLGTDILRVSAATKGRIECGAREPFAVVMLLCAIDPADRRRAKRDYDALITDSFIVVEGSALVVRNFERAQETKTEAATRKAAQRLRQAGEETPPEAPEQHANDKPATNLEHISDKPATNLEQTDNKPSDLTPRKDTLAAVTVTPFLEGKEKGSRYSSPVGEEGDRGNKSPADRPKQTKQAALPGVGELPPKRSHRSRKEPPVDPEPPVGSLAQRVRDAIVADPALVGITAGPGDFALRVCADGAYPLVDVLAEVRRAGEYASRNPGKYRDGRRFLSGWLSRAADDAAAKPTPSRLRPAAGPEAFKAATAAGNPVPGSVAMQRYLASQGKQTAAGEPPT